MGRTRKAEEILNICRAKGKRTEAVRAEEREWKAETGTRSPHLSRRTGIRENEP